MPTLYSYWRSSASYRVRIALNLKGLSYETVPVNLLKGSQQSVVYKGLNPQGLVPFFMNDHVGLAQSLAIIEYLDETHPNPPLLPPDAAGRARVRSVAQIIACDIHPLNNLRVLNYLKNAYGQDEEGVAAWYRHWIAEGFKPLEAMASNGPYFFGEQVTLADICLVPQMMNARRFNLDLTPFPKLVALDAAASKLEAFIQAAPEHQLDAPAAS